MNFLLKKESSAKKTSLKFEMEVNSISNIDYDKFAFFYCFYKYVVQ